MSSPAVDALRAEMAALAAEIKDPLSGFADAYRSALAGEENFGAASDREVKVLQRMLDAMKTVSDGLDGMDALGFPAFPELETDAATKAKFEENERTAKAANARVTTPKAATATLGLGPGVPKIT